MNKENISMVERVFNATITSITPEGVQVTWYRLKKPRKGKKYSIDYFGDFRFLNKRKAYEASKVVSEVENVRNWFNKENRETKCAVINGILYPLYLNQSCQVIETKKGVKIIKIN